MTLSTLIRRTREKKGLSASEVAHRAGYDPSYFSLLERGLRRLSDEGTVRIAQVLGLDPGEALLAGLREHLPENLRRYVPASVGPQDADELRAAARQFQSEDFDFMVGRSTIVASSDWEGNMKVSQTFTDCRPNLSTRPVFEVSFRQLVVGDERSDVPRPDFRILRAPKGLEHQLESTRVGQWQQQRILFPKGWRRMAHKTRDTLAFTMTTHYPGALFLDIGQFVKRAQSQGLTDPLKGCFSTYIRHLVKRLDVSVDFPRGYHPEHWGPWVWWGAGALESSTRNLGLKAARSLSFSASKNSAQLLAEEPLAGYTFSIVWTPLETQRYLEARYGGSDVSD